MAIPERRALNKWFRIIHLSHPLPGQTPRQLLNFYQRAA
jgi:hypothetical protein